MKNQEETEENRRTYFRIDDRLQLSYEVIDPSALDTRKAVVMQGTGGAFMMTSELQALRQESAPLLRQIGGHSPDIASYLEAMERRIELVARFLAIQTSDLIRQPLRDCSLSAGGISFLDKAPLTPGTHVELHLLLGSSHLCITCIAEVVASKRQGADDGYDLHLEFTSIREQDRALLTRHILGRQGEQMRQRRGL